MSAAARGERQRVHVALAQLGGIEPGLGELGAGEAEHFRAAVDAERLLGGGAEQFDHPAGAGADVDQPADRRARRARGRSPPRPRSRRRGASAARPNRRHGWRNSGSAAAARSARTAASRAASAAVQGSAPSSSAQRSTSWNKGSIRGRGPRLRNTQLPSLRRSARPASIRIRTWRETRGWLCPSTCASSPTRELHGAQQHQDPKPGRIRQSREDVGRQSHICGYKDIFISVKVEGRRAVRLVTADSPTLAAGRSSTPYECGSIDSARSFLRVDGVAFLCDPLFQVRVRSP